MADLYTNKEDDVEIIGVQEGEEFKLIPTIKIVGTGGAGSNIADWLYKMDIKGAEVIAANTDYAHLKSVKAHKKVLLGKDVTRGLGAGGLPSKGTEAARASQGDLRKLLEGADMVWITLGLGGGTGTGSAPVVAQIAKEAGVPLIVAVATLPFSSEGGVRREKAEEGLAQLRKYADNVILIDNNKILQYAGNLPVSQAFGYANNIVGQMIKGLVETIAVPSYINLDFADVKTVLGIGGGASIVGIGVADGEKRAEEAAKRALELPLLDVSYEGATGALVHVTGGPDMTLKEVNEVAEHVKKYLGEDSLTILGARMDENMKGKIKATIIISGVRSPYILSKWKEEWDTGRLVKDSNLGIDILNI
ncbi:cell division protein FtsZ [Nanobdella aerobiophila]|uniref:Cell division protein FtsZ n=1 Tax=Nanobdella aerobiophila TaxID=2586965 RepID=A0A915ST02_9ARCH|nr:cell division protein FtsZ [Nanobdella aerobiophila]BBL45771.1 cell division protein FtsZ [Nanobdella aerobiophila]